MNSERTTRAKCNYVVTKHFTARLEHFGCPSIVCRGLGNFSFECFKIFVFEKEFVKVAIYSDFLKTIFGNSSEFFKFNVSL